MSANKHAKINTLPRMPRHGVDQFQLCQLDLTHGALSPRLWQGLCKLCTCNEHTSTQACTLTCAYNCLRPHVSTPTCPYPLELGCWPCPSAPNLPPPQAALCWAHREDRQHFGQAWGRPLAEGLGTQAGASLASSLRGHGPFAQNPTLST